jgi:hypothetical protein
MSRGQRARSGNEAWHFNKIARPTYGQGRFRSYFRCSLPEELSECPMPFRRLIVSSVAPNVRVRRWAERWCRGVCLDAK